MTTRRIVVVGLPLVLAVLIVLGSTPASTADGAPDPKPPAKAGFQLDHLVADLQADGFDVAEGGFQLWAIGDCPQSWAVTGTCYFNNPAAPYVMGVVPHWSDEFVDPATDGAFGPTDVGFGTTFRLDPNEAIVIYGILPPEAAYYGMQSYLFTRKGSYRTDNATYELLTAIGGQAVFFHSLPGNPERLETFDSLSDSHNNVVIERQSGAVWNQLRYFVITPDPHMDAAVRRALHKLSVKEKDIFTERIPGNMRFGLGPDADEFATGIRYSMPADGGKAGTASDEWRNHPALTLLRVRDVRPHRPDGLYPAWKDSSPERRTATDEWGLAPDLNRLVQSVSEAWGQACSDPSCSGRIGRFIDTQTPDFNLVGPKCADIGMDCLGDTQDASYQFRPGYTFDDNEVYAVIGTLGTATGNATYVSLGVNNFRLRLGAKNVEGTQLVGSADPAWYAGVENMDKFYVYYFTRHCEDLAGLTHGFCMSVGESELEVPPGVRATIVERDYLRPGTARGPDSSLTLPSIVLKLHRPGQ